LLGRILAVEHQVVRRTCLLCTADIREMSVVIWRDSVAMGDDIDAPHEWVVRLSAGAPVANLVSEIRRTNYLARVAGGLATWIVEGKQPVAVLAQQWSEPRWLVDSEVSIAALSRETGRANFKVRYWCQVDPERVCACLRAGEPLPDRYGR
jgi:hypothetical protein